ncbi:hypothetical protein [Thermococcus sp.]
MDGGAWGALVVGLLWSFIIFFISIAIVAKLLVGDSWRQRVLLSTLPILSLEASLCAIASMLPPEDPDLILFGIVVAYILYRVFVRFSWVPRLAGKVYVVFEALFPLLALSTFKVRSLFLVNIVLLGATLSLLELTRRRLLPRSKRGGS